MTAPNPAIGGLAPWFGAKRTMAPAVVAEIGPHRAYWELFAGSMAVLLAKPPCRSEVVNDLHGDLVNLARVVQSPTLGPKLYRRLRRVLACEATFREALAVVRSGTAGDEPDVDRAYHYFISSWQGSNGFSGTVSVPGFARRFTSAGGDAGTRWAGAVRSIPAWRRRIERVQVLRSDAIDLAGKIEDREGTAIYADPPYIVKGARYLHDFAPDDHRRLAEALRRFKLTRIVVSYYDHPDLAALYPGWRVVPVAATKSLVNQGRRDAKGATAAPEVLLCNRGPIGDAPPADETFSLTASAGRVAS